MAPRTLPVLVALAIFVLPAAAQDPAAGARKAEACLGCHGPGGSGGNPQYPILAGQTARYLYLQLRDFKEGQRSDPVMSAMAANLSREDMHDLAAYFSSQKPRGNGFKADPARIVRGRAKAAEVLCTMCHLGGFSGQNEIPRVAGQHFDYIVKQLSDFKSGRRTNDAGNMASVTRNLSEGDILDLAHYVADLN